MCARVANNESGNFLVGQTRCKDTGNELHDVDQGMKYHWLDKQAMWF